MAKKTQRRRLYGKRRQRGGVPRWQILLGALAFLPKTAAQSLGELVSVWWNNPNPLDPTPSYRLAQKLLGELPEETTPPGVVAQVKEIANSTATNATGVTPPHTDANETVVEAYLPEVGLRDLKTDGSVYKYGDTEFTVDTWSNKGDTVAISTQDGKTVNVPINATFKVMSEPPKEEDEVGGRRRTTRRKTLRKKK